MKPVLKFHTVHAKNIKREQGGSRVVRKTWGWDGIVFSNRPVSIDERVCIRQSVVSSHWQGVLRFGLTSVDPDAHIIDELPQSAYPELDGKPGYWINELPEQYISQGSLVQFYVSANGHIHYSIDGANKGIFLTGVRHSIPLWVIIDVYGATKAVEFVRPSEDVTSISSSGASTPHTVSSQTTASSQPSLKFHKIHSESIARMRDESRVVRTGSSTCEGIVFSNRSISIGEWVRFRQTEISTEGSGRLRFGVTSVRPSERSKRSQLIQFVEANKEKECWIRMLPKRCASQGSLVQFSISEDGHIDYSIDGIDKGTFLSGVDTSKPLWAIFDVHGTVKAVEFVSADEAQIIDESIRSRLRELTASIRVDSPIAIASTDQKQTKKTTCNDQKAFVPRPFPSQTTPSKAAPTAQTQMTSSPATNLCKQESPDQMTSLTIITFDAQTQTTSPSIDFRSIDECSICMEGEVGAVIYPCGHMSMCYECAVKIKIAGSGCPICHKPIRDIIKTFEA